MRDLIDFHARYLRREEFGGRSCKNPLNVHTVGIHILLGDARSIHTLR